MSISTPPPAPRPKKKLGCGCFGCGCLILAAILVLLGALTAGGVYIAYDMYHKVTSETAADIPVPNADPKIFEATQQKLADFLHDVKNHQPATVSLSANEINALIANNPDIVKTHAQVFMSMHDDYGRIQASVPTSAMGSNVNDGRYLNVDSSFGIHFDTVTKNINFDFHVLRAGNMTLIGKPAENEKRDPNSFSESFVRNFSGSFGPSFNQSFNAGLKKNPDVAALLNQATTVDIENGQIVIKTQ